MSLVVADLSVSKGAYLNERPSKTSLYWTVTFERGESLTDVGLAGIASLEAVNPKKRLDGLSKYHMFLPSSPTSSEEVGLAIGLSDCRC